MKNQGTEVNLRQKIADLEGEKNALADENMLTNVKLETLKECMKTKENELSDSKLKNTRMENVMDDINNEKQHCKDQIETQAVEMKEMLDESTKQKEKINRKEKEMHDLVQKCIEAEQRNHEATTAQTSTSDEGKKRSTLLLTDSNGRRIKPKLPRDEGIEWLHLKNIWRATDIPQQINTTEGRRHMQKAENIMIMVGLNELIDGKSARQALNSLRENIQPLIRTDKPITLIEIPPIEQTVTLKNEARIFNTMLKQLSREHKNITVLECWDTLSHYLPEEIFEEDDEIHLDTNKPGTTEMAKLIVNHTKTILQEPPAKDIITKTINIEEGTAQHFIGSSGRTLKRMTNDHAVNISIPRNTNKVIITGNPENVNNANEEILQIKKSVEQRGRQQTIGQRQQPKIQCRFYIRGFCNKGDLCHYEHNRNEEQSRNTSEQSRAYRSRSPVKVNQNRSRSHLRNENNDQNQSSRSERSYRTERSKSRTSRRDNSSRNHSPRTNRDYHTHSR